jgi:hypothetical protein
MLKKGVQLWSCSSEPPEGKTKNAKKTYTPQTQPLFYSRPTFQAGQTESSKEPMELEIHILAFPPVVGCAHVRAKSRTVVQSSPGASTFEKTTRISPSTPDTWPCHFLIALLICRCKS